MENGRKNWDRGILVSKALIGCAYVFLTPFAYAVDGVIEINQTCAENSGCMAGDSAGFPVLITEPGSYRLTGNLTLTGANDWGIQVNAAHVTIDLNGFSIIGPAVCSGGPPVTGCTNSGTGLGILAPNNALYHHITIRNGDIKGIGGSGISMSGTLAVHVENVRAISNASQGIWVGPQAVVKDCVAESNLVGGIIAGARARISNATAVFNDGTGISAGESSLIQNSSAITNDSHGIGCTDACLIDTVVSRANGVAGASAGDDSIVQNSTITFNMTSGINCGDGCLVRSNTASGNANNQIIFSGESSYVGNTLTGAGTVSGAGAVEIGPNLCNGNTDCP